MSVKYYLSAVQILLSGVIIASGADLIIAENGKTEYQIVVPDSSSHPEISSWLAQTAQLMQDAFKINGFSVPVVPESSKDKARPGIYLGNTEFARASGIDVSKFTNWTYVQKAVGCDIIIAGCDRPSRVDPNLEAKTRTTLLWHRLGTVKGATDFLRQYTGTRFLFPDLKEWETSWPANNPVSFTDSTSIEFLPTPKIVIPADLNIYKTPVLLFNRGLYPERAGFYDIANNMFPMVDIKYNGHTYERAIPDKYRDSHPEYYALIGSRRCNKVKDWKGELSTQYCISNPEVQELFYQDMIKWLDGGYETVDLGQPDGLQPCQCLNCKRLYDTGDDWGEKLWILHRKLAERVTVARPGKKVILMSYMHTEQIPKSFTNLPQNTLVALGSTEEEDFKSWNKICVPGGFISYLYNWCPNLTGPYVPMRTPLFVEMQAKRLYKNNVRGIIRDGPGEIFGLEGPVYYVFGRMFDDPEKNRAADLMQEFCQAAYGKAAGAMQQFFDRLYYSIELYSQYLGTRCPAWSFIDINGRRRKFLTDPFRLLAFLYPPDMLAALEKDLAQAEKLANTDKTRKRIALVRVQFDYVKHLASVAHLYQAFQIQPDRILRDRLLDAIDARNAHLDSIKPIPGWPEVRPLPHDKNHWKLSKDTYQGPFRNTVLNWDTKAMRNAPLPGARKISARPVNVKIDLDSPEWKQAAEQVLDSGTNAAVSCKAACRILYDFDCFYLRLDRELPDDRAVSMVRRESLDVRLAPLGNNDQYYRFVVGPAAALKYDAANGFITDVMDPRHGKDDPDWEGEWKYETRLESEQKRWVAVLQIPFKTMGAKPPAGGTVWTGHIGYSFVVSTDQVKQPMPPVSLAPLRDVDRCDFWEIVFEK